MVRNLPIKFYATVTVASPVFVLCLLLSVVWYFQATESAVLVAKETMRGSHEVIARHVERQLGMAPRVVALNKDLISSGMLSTDALQSWRSIFVNELVSAYPGLSAIVWADTSGRALWIGRYSDGGIYWALKEDGSDSRMKEWRLGEDFQFPEHPTSEFEYDVFKRPWFRTVVDRAEPGWTPPFVWAGGEDVETPTIGVSYGIPILDDNGEVGQVVDADYSLHDLSKHLMDIALNPSGLTLIIDERSRVLASSKEITSLVSDGEMVGISQIGDERLDAAIRQGGAADFDFLGDGELIRITEEDQDFFLMASTLEGDLSLDWTIVSLVPTDVFLDSASAALRYGLLISCFGLLAALIVGATMARRLSVPIQKLSLAAKRIGKGDAGTKAPEFSIPEFNDLSMAVNTLGDVLESRQNLVSELEFMGAKERLLRRELDHRVMNTLAQMSVLCNQAFDDATADKPILEDLSARVDAFASVHDLLNRVRNISIDLEELIQSVLEPYTSTPATHLKMVGPSISVGPKAAVTFAMVLNELAMNASKYGALKSTSGVVEISWMVDSDAIEGRQFHLHWNEVHDLPIPESIDGGFGTLFIREAIPHELGGEVELRLEEFGVWFRVSVDIDRIKAENRSMIE